MRAGEGSYTYFDHAADVGIRIRAATLESLFATAGRALMEWIGPAPAAREVQLEKIELQADHPEELLVRWLQELLFVFHERRLYFLDAESLQIGEGTLSGEIAGARWDPASSGDFQEIKAVTYHQLRLTRDDGGWTASVILDI